MFACALVYVNGEKEGERKERKQCKVKRRKSMKTNELHTEEEERKAHNKNK